jgi:hypothetical protein
LAEAALPATVNSPTACSVPSEIARALTLAVLALSKSVNRPIDVKEPARSRTTPDASTVSAAVKLPPTNTVSVAGSRARLLTWAV